MKIQKAWLRKKVKKEGKIILEQKRQEKLEEVKKVEEEKRKL